MAGSTFLILQVAPSSYGRRLLLDAAARERVKWQNEDGHVQSTVWERIVEPSFDVTAFEASFCQKVFAKEKSEDKGPAKPAVQKVTPYYSLLLTTTPYYSLLTITT